MTIWRIENKIAKATFYHLIDDLKGQITPNWGASYVTRNPFFKLYKFSFERFWIKIEWESHGSQSSKTHNLTILGLLETNDHLNVTICQVVKYIIKRRVVAFPSPNHDESCEF